jgi:hypothetical protein
MVAMKDKIHLRTNIFRIYVYTVYNIQKIFHSKGIVKLKYIRSRAIINPLPELTGVSLQ